MDIFPQWTSLKICRVKICNWYIYSQGVFLLHDDHLPLDPNLLLWRGGHQSLLQRCIVPLVSGNQNFLRHLWGFSISKVVFNLLFLILTHTHLQNPFAKGAVQRLSWPKLNRVVTKGIPEGDLIQEFGPLGLVRRGRGLPLRWNYWQAFQKISLAGKRNSVCSKTFSGEIYGATYGNLGWGRVGGMESAKQWPWRGRGILILLQDFIRGE